MGEEDGGGARVVIGGMLENLTDFGGAAVGCAVLGEVLVVSVAFGAWAR